MTGPLALLYPLRPWVALTALIGALFIMSCDQPRAVPVPTYGPSSAAPPAAAIAEAVPRVPPLAHRQDLVLSDTSRQGLLRFARLACNGQAKDAEQLPLPGELAQVKAPVILMAFDADGTRTLSRRLDDPDLPVAGKLARLAPLVCSGRTDLFLHVLVVSFTSRMPNLGLKGIFDNRVFEPQVTGLIWEREGQRAELDPVEAVQLNLGPEGARHHLARALGTNAKRLVNDNKLSMEVYRVIHFGEGYPDRNFVDFHRGHQVLLPAQVSHELLEARLKLIGDWYRHNIRDGEVTYEYSVRDDREQNQGRTMVRSTMATWILNRLAFYLNDAELKQLGEQVIGWYLKNYFQIEKSLAAGKIQPSSLKLPSGNMAKNRPTAGSFIAAAIGERDDRQRWARETTLLLDWAIGYIREDGVLWTQAAENQYFDPGQMLLAISYHYDRTRDEQYKRAFDRMYTAYEGPFYDAMHLGPGRYTPYAPAWFTQPAAKMYLVTGDNRYRDMVYAINDRVVLLYEHNARDQVYYDYDGGLLPKTAGFGNNSITAAALESLTDAAIVAQKDGDQVRLATYARVIRHTVAFLLRLQYIPANTYYIRNKTRATGGFRKDMIDSTLWMDNVWHLTSAFMKVQQHRLLELTASSPTPAAPPAPQPATAAPVDAPPAPGTTR